MRLRDQPIPRQGGLVSVDSALELNQLWLPRSWHPAIVARLPMRRFAMKALFTALSFGRAERDRIDWDRRILIFSTAVTLALIAIYAWAKATSRWG